MGSRPLRRRAMIRLDPDDRRTLPAVVVSLADGVHMAECVDRDGTITFWLLGDHKGRHGCACRRCASHERTGPLPADLRDRLGLRHRCGAATRSTGQPCRSLVSERGLACAAHQPEAAR